MRKKLSTLNALTCRRFIPRTWLLADLCESKTFAEEKVYRFSRQAFVIYKLPVTTVKPRSNTSMITMLTIKTGAGKGPTGLSL